MDKGINLQQMAMNTFLEFLKFDRSQDEKKKGLLKRMMNDAIRMMGAAYRMLRVHAKDEAKKGKRLGKRQRGVCRRMLDSNIRIMRQAWISL